jgi:hypothetical protein
MYIQPWKAIFILHIFVFSFVDSFNKLMIYRMDWNNGSKQQCICVYIVGIDPGSSEAENGVFNLLDFLCGNHSGESAHYCDYQVQQDTWEPHVLFLILFVLC